jgi:hypothetical protein
MLSRALKLSGKSGKSGKGDEDEKRDRPGQGESTEDPEPTDAEEYFGAEDNQGCASLGPNDQKGFRQSEVSGHAPAYQVWRNNDLGGHPGKVRIGSSTSVSEHLAVCLTQVDSHGG